VRYLNGLCPINSNTSNGLMIKAGRSQVTPKGFLPYPLLFKVIIMNRCIDCGIAIKDYFDRCYNCNNIRKLNRNSGSIDLNPEIKINFMKEMGIDFC